MNSGEVLGPAKYDWNESADTARRAAWQDQVCVISPPSLAF